MKTMVQMVTKFASLPSRRSLGHLCEHKTARSGLYMPRTILDHVQIDVLLRYLEVTLRKGYAQSCRTGIRSADGVTRARETIASRDPPLS